jgi:hypothetical protein
MRTIMTKAIHFRRSSRGRFSRRSLAWALEAIRVRPLTFDPTASKRARYRNPMRSLLAEANSWQHWRSATGAVAELRGRRRQVLTQQLCAATYVPAQKGPRGRIRVDSPIMPTEQDAPEVERSARPIRYGCGLISCCEPAGV